MIIKTIPTKQLALFLGLILILFGLGIMGGRPMGKSNLTPAPQLSKYQWVLKVDGQTDEEAFHVWPADQQMELKEWREQRTPEISYRLSARVIDGFQEKIQLERTLKLQCRSENEISEIQFDENKVPNTFQIRQRCGLRFWILKLRKI